MAISFSGIPDTVRTPGVYTEIDKSRALKGLVQNPHKVLILGQKIAAGTKSTDTLVSISSNGLADGFFGPGSVLARMCNVFKDNNPNTELWALAVSTPAGAVEASGALRFSVALSATGGSLSGTETYNLLINGVKAYTTLTSGWSAVDCASAVTTKINADSTLPVVASVNILSGANESALVGIRAVCSGALGNYIDFRENYYVGESDPTGFGDSVLKSAMELGATNPDIGDAWAIIDGEQFQYIIQPYADAANLTEIEDELADRFEPLEELQGHGFVGLRGTLASCTTIGNSRNSPHNTIIGAHNSPTGPEEWAAALGAVAAWNLNNDPARPLQFLKLKGVLPPPVGSLFTRAERDILLYDGIATFIEKGGKTLIERCVTTYQSNALGILDPTYLDVNTLATLGEIRYQYKARMISRFIEPRFKLADDDFPVQPGSHVATPKTVAQETVSLFVLLRDKGLIENLDDFVNNLVVERDDTDRNRINVLLSPDLINQFRILAGLIQFIL